MLSVGSVILCPGKHQVLAHLFRSQRPFELAQVDRIQFVSGEETSRLYLRAQELGVVTLHASSGILQIQPAIVVPLALAK